MALSHGGWMAPLCPQGQRFGILVAVLERAALRKGDVPPLLPEIISSLATRWASVSRSLYVPPVPTQLAIQGLELGRETRA